MTRRTRHLTLTMITTLAALVLAGAALAQWPNDQDGIGARAVAASAQTADAVSPNDRGGMTGVGAVAVSAQAPDAFERAAMRANTSTPGPDVLERAAIRAAADTPTRPDDRAGVRGPGLASTGSVLLAAPAETGFQWGDASLGAGIVLGVLLVAGLVGLTIRHRGGPVSV
jgi:hypothetical protein